MLNLRGAVLPFLHMASHLDAELSIGTNFHLLSSEFPWFTLDSFKIISIKYSVLSTQPLEHISTNMDACNQYLVTNGSVYL
jgi:hypothetical protein